MEIILRQDVQGIGKAGSIVRVKDGFAHNFLIPKGLGVLVNQSNIKNLEQDKLKKATQLEKLKKEALALKDKLDSLSLTVPAMAQDDDKIYGSITSQEIEQLLKEEGFNIDKSSILLDEPIKSLGIYEVPVKLHPEVSSKVKIWIVKK